jgi:hypothetical protein
LPLAWHFYSFDSAESCYQELLNFQRINQQTHK